MKKYIVFIIGIILLNISAISNVSAGGNIYPGVAEITLSKTTVIANSSDTVAIAIYAYYYQCESGVFVAQNYGDCEQYYHSSYHKVAFDGVTNHHPLNIEVSGSGNVISSDKVDLNVSGRAEVSLKSSTQGIKTIKIVDNDNPLHDSFVLAEKNISFTAPSPTPITKATPKATTPTVTKPSAPVVSKISNKDITKNADGTFIPTIIRQGNPITFSGTTSANATIHLTINSDPITADVKADADGNWTYTLDKEIALGDHTVDATVTDSAGQTSDSATIALFTLKEPIAPISTTSEPTPSVVMSLLTWGLTALAVLLIPVAVWLDILRRRKKNINSKLSNI